MQDDLKSTRQAAAYIRLKKKTLESWRCQCRGPAYVKIGARIFYRTRDLDAFVERNRHDPSATPVGEAVR